MARRKPFVLTYDPEVQEHLQAIEPKYHSLIDEAIREQLQFEPDQTTRNRKPLRRPARFQAGWELRFGPDNRFRAFYRIDEENHEVVIMADGRKERNRLFIGGKEEQP
jgi:mRNA-degrading endonuclease RelE of RelBE toxin-antitoxin system